MPRRERWSVLGDVLLAIDRERAQRGPSFQMTRVASRANVPYNRLAEYVAILASAGFVAGGARPQVTPKGRELLRRYEAWRSFVTSSVS